MKVKGYSFIELLIALLLLSLCMTSSMQWLLQSSYLHTIASQQTQLTLIATSIAQGISGKSDLTKLKAYWEPKLKAILKDAELSLNTHAGITTVLIETHHPHFKTLQWKVVSG